MKRFFLTLAMTLIMSGIYAQEQFSFMDIPFDCTPFSFYRQLSSRGFKSCDILAKRPLYKGEFLGREVIVCAANAPDSDYVNTVGVLLDLGDEWKDLVCTYNAFKSIYTRNFGEPEYVTEVNPCIDDSNDILMGQIENIDYRCAWVRSGGVIELSIIKCDDSMGMAKLTYQKLEE